MEENLRRDQQPILPLPEEQERLLERFVAALEAYKKRIEQYITYDEKLLGAALRKPPGIQHNPGLYRDSEGKFWKMSTGDYEGKRQGVLIEYIRPAGSLFGKYEAVLSPYRSMDDMKSMTRSLDVPQEDWAWEEIDERDREKGRKDTATITKTDLDKNRFAQTFIEELLRQKDAIKQWIKEYARASDRLNYSEKADVDAFYSHFFPSFQSAGDEAGQPTAHSRKDIPDLTSIHVAFHEVLNALAGYPDIKVYLY